MRQRHQKSNPRAAVQKSRAGLTAILGAAMMMTSVVSVHAYDAKVTWTANAKATGYKIHTRHLSAPMVGDPGSRGRPVNEVIREIFVSRGSGGASVLSHTLRNLPLGPTVMFSVSAVDAHGEGRRSKEQMLTYAHVASVVDTDGDGLIDEEEDRNLNGLLDADETDSLSADSDGDGVDDRNELYKTGTDPRARDSDRDGIGDATDACSDVDGDGYGSRAGSKSCPLDNCPWTRNSNQFDTDGDGAGDVCDACTNIAGRQDFYQNHRLAFRRVHADERFGYDAFDIDGDFRLPAGIDFEVLNPAAQGARIRIESSDGTGLTDFVLPPGEHDRDRRASGWRRNEINKSWRYVDRDPNARGGVNRMTVKDMSKRWPGTVRIEISGKNGAIPIASSDSPVVASIALGDQLTSRAGACAETPYVRADCVFGRQGKTFTCE